MRFLRIGMAAVPVLLLAVSETSPAGATKALGQNETEIRAALEAAIAAFENGSIPAARYWSARATALLEAVDEGSRLNSFPLGNASQLLDVLEVYSFVADGSNADLDAQVQWLVEQLHIIRSLDESARKPVTIGNVIVDYAPFTKLVRRVGDLSIDRDPFTQQIRRIGDLAIDYDPFTYQPRRIGTMTVDYDPFNGELREIAGIRLH